MFPPSLLSLLDENKFSFALALSCVMDETIDATASAHLNVFQWDDASRLFVRRVFKVVEAVVVEDEPAPLPRFVPAALLPQPTFPVGIEEGVHQVVAVVFGNFKRLRFDALIKALKKGVEKNTKRHVNF